ncbi:MAG: pseudouridylate synthase [Bacteroidales bacterium]|nr:pseudouridylate synthase [Bacteroidales bacterium]
MSVPDFEQIEVGELLPQRPPMVMIDRLLQCDPVVTQTALTVRPDNIFCDNGYLSEAGLLENIAQTCAARMGFINKYLQHDVVKLGFIGAIRNMEIFRLPASGEQLTTTVTVQEEIFRMTLVHAEIRIHAEVIASGDMKISITDINSAP